MNPVLYSAPATEPVSTADAKTHLRITGEDSYIEGLIKAARQQVERYLGRALITQTWDVYYDCWYNAIKLPYPTIQSVTHVKYYDGDGVQQTLSSSLYYVVNQSDPGYIVKKYDVTYPELEDGRPSAIVVRQICGYGDTAATVPAPIVHAIKLLVTDMYENRGTVVLGSVQKIPNYIIDLIHSYKIYDLS